MDLAGSARCECWSKGEQDISKIVGMVTECWIVGCRMLLMKEVETNRSDKGDEDMKGTWKRNIAISHAFLEY